MSSFSDLLMALWSGRPVLKWHKEMGAVQVTF